MFHQCNVVNLRYLAVCGINYTPVEIHGRHIPLVEFRILNHPLSTLSVPPIYGGMVVCVRLVFFFGG